MEQGKIRTLGLLCQEIFDGPWLLDARLEASVCCHNSMCACI